VLVQRELEKRRGHTADEKGLGNLSKDVYDKIRRFVPRRRGRERVIEDVREGRKGNGACRGSHHRNHSSIDAPTSRDSGHHGRGVFLNGDGGVPHGFAFREFRERMYDDNRCVELRLQGAGA
jgi:hypothetical protein